MISYVNISLVSILPIFFISNYINMFRNLDGRDKKVKEWRENNVPQQLPSKPAQNLIPN